MSVFTSIVALVLALATLAPAQTTKPTTQPAEARVFTAIGDRTNRFKERVYADISTVRSVVLEHLGKDRIAGAKALAASLPRGSRVMLNLHEVGYDIRFDKPEQVVAILSEMRAIGDVFRAAGHDVGHYNAMITLRSGDIRAWQRANDLIDLLIGEQDTIYVDLYYGEAKPSRSLYQTAYEAARIVEAFRVAKGRPVVFVVSPYAIDGVTPVPWSVQYSTVYAVRDAGGRLLVWADQIGPQTDATVLGANKLMTRPN